MAPAGSDSGSVKDVRRKPLPVVIVCVSALALNILLVGSLFVPNAWSGRNDFLSLYAGARLAGTPDLYNPAAIRDVQARSIGEAGESLQFSRLPYYALILKPLSWLPYRTAYLVWVCFSSAFAVGFAALWPDDRKTIALLCCSSLPAVVSLLNGQDVSLLLIVAAAAVWLLRRGNSFAAGLVLALMASKYHLAILVPLVILAQRRWRMAAGAASALAVLLAGSFIVAGARWPWQYYVLLTSSPIHPGTAHMPNLHGLLGALRFGVYGEAAAALLLGVLVIRTALRVPSFEWPFALALAAGILVSFHGYLADCALLLPALVLTVSHSAPQSVRLPALALASPVPWFLLQLPAPLPAVTQLLIVGLVIGMSRTLPYWRCPAKSEAPLEIAQGT